MPGWRQRRSAVGPPGAPHSVPLSTAAWRGGPATAARLSCFVPRAVTWGRPGQRSKESARRARRRRRGSSAPDQSCTRRFACVVPLAQASTRRAGCGPRAPARCAVGPTFTCTRRRGPTPAPRRPAATRSWCCCPWPTCKRCVVGRGLHLWSSTLKERGRSQGGAGVRAKGKEGARLGGGEVEVGAGKQAERGSKGGSKEEGARALLPGGQPSRGERAWEVGGGGADREAGG